MHRVWSILEVAQHIINSEALKARDLARVARVSSWFWELAAPRLWEEIRWLRDPGNPYLEALLPNELVEAWLQGGHGNSGPQPATSSTFERFNRYRNFIKRIAIGFNGDRDAQILEALADRSGLKHPLFPNLRHLDVTSIEYGPQNTEVIQAFLAPNIRRLRLWFYLPLSSDDDDTYTTDEAISSAIRKCHEARLPLTELDIDPGCMGQDLSKSTWEVLSNFLASLISLRRLNLEGLNTPQAVVLFTLAAELPNLLELNTSAPNVWNQDARYLLAKGFPTLKHLHIVNRDTSFNVVRGILTHVAPAEIQELHLKFSSWDDHRTESDQFYAPERFKGLRIFDLEWNTPSDVRREDIVLLTKCRQLERVKLVGFGTASLFDDQMLLRVAEAWPNLRSFEVTETFMGVGEDEAPPNNTPPLVTLRGVAGLTKRCTSLESVSISVDARGTPPTIIAPASHSIRHLAFHESHIDENLDNVFSYIAQMWPNVEPQPEKILDDPFRDPDVGATAHEFANRWCQVWDRIARSKRMVLAWADKDPYYVWGQTGGQTGP